MYSLKKIGRKITIALLALVIIWQWGQAAFISGKAWLAQGLIAHAWQQTLNSGSDTKPWPWADTWPVAKILIHQQTFYVLAGSTGNSLAFGPGHDSATALPGTKGSSVIGGHRDTHFYTLKHLTLGDKLTIQNQQGEWNTYQASQTSIVDSQTQQLLINPSHTAIYLITCYPFDNLVAGGSERFIAKFDWTKEQ